MDASERIITEFDRLITFGRDAMRDQPYAQRMVFYVVVARCEADMQGFSSIYEQALSFEELHVLIEGLQKLGEPKLAAEFASGVAALLECEFYRHLNWNRVPACVKSQIEEIGVSVGSHLWSLDEKLVGLLNGDVIG